MTDTPDRSYVLGTHDAEIERLGMQHAVWWPRVRAAWQRAGFTAGQTVVDVGCGPGYATLDLAELVGRDGRVIAVDRSRRFLEALDVRRRGRGMENVTIVESDLDDVDLGAHVADGAWCRWVLAFVPRPRDLLRRIERALRPNGVFVSHEYFDYATWRSMPRSAGLEDFVTATIANWRQSGGEPDVGLDIPRWLEELGFEIESIAPLVYVISSRDSMWQWLNAFMAIGLQRWRELGTVDPARAAAIEQAMSDVFTSPTARVITPGVLEVIARKR